MFINWYTKLYASGCKYRGSLYNGIEARLYSCCERLQTATIVIEASGDDYFRMCSILFRIVRRIITTKKDYGLY